MVPDDDFFALYCNRCKRKYTFQDIRARLGNDLHSLEIGDLTQEGYEMTESESIRELDLERSNYLSKMINVLIPRMLKKLKKTVKFHL